MKTKLEINLLKDLQDIQKIDHYLTLNSQLIKLNQQKIVSETSQFLIDQNIKVKEKILEQFLYNCINPVEAIKLNYCYSLNNNTLSSFKNKVEIESFSILNKDKTYEKQIIYSPCLMYYNIVSTLKKNIVKFDNENKLISIHKNSFIKYSIDNFYLLGWGTKMHIGTISLGYFYVLNFDLVLVKIINLKKIKKLIIKKKSDVIFQYEDRKQNKCITLFSSINRKLFVEEVLDANSHIVIEAKDFSIKYYSKFEREYQKRFILSLLENKTDEIIKSKEDIDLRNFRNSINFQIVKKMISLIKVQCPNSYYKYELTYNKRKTKFCHMGDISQGQFSKINLLPYIYNQEIVSKIFSIIYFNFNNLHCDFSKNKKYQSYLKISFSLRKKISRIEIDVKKQKDELLELKGIKNRPRKEIEKRRKKNLAGKCVYSNVIFKVSNTKNSKSNKELVVSTGKFVIRNQKENDKVSALYHLNFTFLHFNSVSPI